MKKIKPFFLPLLGVILLLVGFYIVIIFKKQNNNTVEVTQRQFDKMLKEGEVKDVVLVRNWNLVEIALTEEALAKEEYNHIVASQSLFANTEGPHFKLKIPNQEFFDIGLHKAQEDIAVNERIDYRVEERSDFMRFLLNRGPLFLFPLVYLVIIILLLRFVFKLFWLSKPKEKRHETVDKQSLNGSDPTENHQSNFPVKIGDRTIFLEMNQIVSFQAKDNYVNVLDTEDNTYLVEYTLNELDEKLPRHFIRIHRSYIVNKLLIKEIRKHSGNRYTVHLKSKKSQQLVSSQSYAPKVKELMKF